MVQNFMNIVLFIQTVHLIYLAFHYFQQCMKDISASFKRAYKCTSIALIPGSGTYGMEAIARQFGTNKKMFSNP